MAWAIVTTVRRWSIAMFCVGVITMPMQAVADDLTALNQELLEHFQNGDYFASIDVAERAIARAKAEFGESRPEYAAQLGKLAHLFLIVNRIPEAEPLFRRALEICTQTLPPDHPDLVDALDGMATGLSWLNRREEAEPLLKRVYAIREKTIDGTDPAFLDLVDRMSHRQGGNKEGERILREAVGLIESKLGLDHPYLAPLITDLASLNKMTWSGNLAPKLSEQIDGNAARSQEIAKLRAEMRKPGADKDALLDKIFELNKKKLSELKEPNEITKAFAGAEPLEARSRAVLSHAIAAGTLDRSTKLVIGSMVNALSSLAMSERAAKRFAEAEQVYRLIRDLRIPTVNANYAGGLMMPYYQMFTTDFRIRLDGNSPRGPAPGDNWFLGMHGLLEVYEDQQRFAEFESTAQEMIEAADKLVNIKGYAGKGRSRKSATIKKLLRFYEERKNYAQVEVYLKQELDLLRIAADPLQSAEALARVPGRDTPLGFAGLYERMGRFDDAEATLNQAIKIRTEVQGPAHPAIADLKERIRRLRLKAAGDSKSVFLLPSVGYVRSSEKCSDFVGAIEHWAERKAEMREHCTELEWSSLERVAEAQRQEKDDPFGIDSSLSTLADAAIEKKNWADADTFLSRIVQNDNKARKRSGKPAYIGLTRLDANMRPVMPHVLLIKTAYRAAEQNPSRSRELLETTFAASQQAYPLAAAGALGEMTARQAKGNPALATLIRERQDLGGEWEALDLQWAEALKRSDQQRDAAADRRRRERVQAIDARLGQIDKHLAKDFPDYKSLGEPDPLTIAETQLHLRDDEALVQFVFTPPLGIMFQIDVPAEAFVWVVTKTASRWAKVDMPGKALAEHIIAMRCGLDQSSWAAGTKTREGCVALLKPAASEQDLPPFDVSRAQSLYAAMFGPVQELIAGKHLLLVPTGPFTILPFAVLVAEKPSFAGVPDYREVRWLGRQQPLSLLPSVASLKFLRERVRPSNAPKPFLGFGNPLLDGNPENSAHRERAVLARRKTSCASATEALGRLRITFSEWPVPSNLLRDKSSDVAALRRQLPLPETADELCAVASNLGADDESVRLGANMTEAVVKKLSTDGHLRDFRVLHFATHGLVAGETEFFLQGGVEPSLMFTPPAEPSVEDDGLLTASEVMDLKLDADWVVMSACNTAAGGAREAEALSGLARAFFYAGARSLLVSHWAVDSDAAVTITTGAFGALKTNPAIGRAEALRLSLARLIDQGGRNAHPAIWAPFVLVGEGAPH